MPRVDLEIGQRMPDGQTWQQDAVEGDPLVLTGGAVAADVEELPLVTWDPTGDEAVDAALARLATGNGLTPAEQVDIFDAVHRELHARLGQGASEVESGGGMESR